MEREEWETYNLGNYEKIYPSGDPDLDIIYENYIE
jgi:hypothetical protein